jgi:hypothetical protein
MNLTGAGLAESLSGKGSAHLFLTGAAHRRFPRGFAACASGGNSPMDHF